MLTRITDWKILWVCIHIYQITKIEDLVRIILCHTDNRKYFLSVSLMRNRREAHIFYLAKEVGKCRHVIAEKMVIL